MRNAKTDSALRKYNCHLIDAWDPVSGVNARGRGRKEDTEDAEVARETEVEEEDGWDDDGRTVMTWWAKLKTFYYSTSAGHYKAEEDGVGCSHVM